MIARNEIEDEGQSLIDCMRKNRPTCLIGLSGQGGLFSKEILEEMNEQPENWKPIIFPLSNPTSRAECTAEEALIHTNYNAIFGSGSPFNDITNEGKIYRANQVNNVYIYPGLALGAVLGDTKIITDSMIVTSAEALSEMIPKEDYDKNSIYPCLSKIREISVHIASRVIEQAHKERRLNNPKAKTELLKSFDDLKAYVKRNQWVPEYKPLVYSPKN